MHGLKTAFNHGFAQHLPGAHGTGKPFEMDRAKLAALEQAADAPTCFRVDHCASRISKGL